MLQEVNGTIQEQQLSNMAMTLTGGFANATFGGSVTNGGIQISTNWAGDSYWVYPQPYYYWHSYPVYVCTDKTKKAIDVLKALEADKLIKCQSVPKFIALVEKIAGLL